MGSTANQGCLFLVSTKQLNTPCCAVFHLQNLQGESLFSYWGCFSGNVREGSHKPLLCQSWPGVKFTSLTIFLWFIDKNGFHGWKDCSELKIICCAYRGPEVDSQHHTSNSWLSGTPTLGDLTPSSGLCGFLNLHAHVHMPIYISMILNNFKFNKQLLERFSYL